MRMKLTEWTVLLRWNVISLLNWIMNSILNRLTIMWLERVFPQNKSYDCRNTINIYAKNKKIVELSVWTKIMTNNKPLEDKTCQFILVKQFGLVRIIDYFYKWFYCPFKHFSFFLIAEGRPRNLVQRKYRLNHCLAFVINRKKNISIRPNENIYAHLSTCLETIFVIAMKTALQQSHTHTKCTKNNRFS